MKATCAAAAVLLAASISSARAAMFITEWAYNGNDGEFVELTNTGPAAVDMTGWSFDDDSRTAGSLSLSSFGVVAPFESVVVTDNSAAAFRTAWGLSPAVKVIGGNSQNLSRNDEINVYNAANALVDRLTFGDQNIPGTIRTQNVSGNPITFAALGANNAALWKLAVVGDAYGSHVSVLGDIGNPGQFSLIPEPSSLFLLGVSLVSLRRARSRQ